MPEHSSPFRAAIDIGSNTVRALVATYTSDTLKIVVDEEELVRIGESVTATGSISEQKYDETISVLQRYQSIIAQYTTETVPVVATEAIRQAKNGNEFLAAIERETGLKVLLIEGSLEAVLTFYGATYEVTHGSDRTGLVGVIDLGGGSTELVVADGQRILSQSSFPVGSGWLRDRYLASNPATHDEIVVARTFLRTYFSGISLKRRPSLLLATGGSANYLLRLAQRAFGLGEQEHQLSREDLARCEGVLSVLSAEEIAQRFQLPVKRAQILLAGVLIIGALLDRLQLNTFEVTPHGLREGVLLASAQFGDDWTVQIQKKSESASNAKDKNGDAKNQTEETFLETGRQALLERLGIMLDWQDEVLKHEDIESVHKMRVASRRLRALMDAYQTICDPGPFKKAYRRIKEIADVLGKARDSDVMIQNLKVQCEQVPVQERPGIQWLIERLKGYREQHQRELEKFLNELDSSDLEREVKACLPKGGTRNGKS